MPETPVQPSVSAPPRPLSQQDYNFSLNRDLRALNASVLVITQKIKYLVRNEKILGRNLIVINKRVRDLQAQAGSGGSSETSDVSQASRAALDDLSRQVSALSARLADIETKLEDVSARAAKEEEVKEIKYLVEAINPLHLITADQAKKMMDERARK